MKTDHFIVSYTGSIVIWKIRLNYYCNYTLNY